MMSSKKARYHKKKLVKKQSPKEKMKFNCANFSKMEGATKATVNAGLITPKSVTNLTSLVQRMALIKDVMRHVAFFTQMCAEIQ